MLDTGNVAQSAAATGAEINSEIARYQKGIALAIEKMRLRQWAVEQTVKLATSLQVASLSGELVKEITEYFFNFVTEQKENPDDKTS
jgi:hypothetical protein